MQVKYYFLLLGLLLMCWTTPAAAGTTNDVRFHERIQDTIGTSTYQDGNAYYFNVSQQGVVKIDAKYINRSYGVALYTAGGHVLLVDHYAVTEDGQVAFALKPGQYRILISATSGTSYDFSLSFEAGEYDDVEPNNTFEEGKVIAPDTTIQGFTNKLNSFYKDVYIFEVTQATKLRVDKQKAEMTLYAKNGTEIYESNEAQSTFTINIQPGVYYFEVLGDRYQFSYQIEDASQTVELEPNNSLNTAQQLLLNTTYDAQFAGNFDRSDDYTFTLTEPALVELALTNSAPLVTLYDDKGTSFATDIYTKGYKMALKAGTYTLKLQCINGDEKDYSIALYTAAVSNSSLEPNDSIQLAQPIELGQLLQQPTSNGLRYHNYYKVDVPADGVLKVETSNADMSVTLYDEDEQYWHMYEKDNVYMLGVKKGTYYVNIGNRETPRSFKITFQAMPVEYESNDANMTAQPLAQGVKTRGYLVELDELDTFLIDVQKSGTYALTTMRVAGWEIEPYVTLTNAQDDVVFKGFLNDTKKLALEKGTYYAKITANGTIVYDILWDKQIAAKFSDVPLTHIYYKEIAALNELGVINGYEDGMFKPNDSIKRHNAAAMIVRANAPALPTTVSYAFTFKDVSASHPNYTNIQRLVEGGIVDQNKDGFKPNATITRAQMAKMIVKAFKLTYNKDSDPLTFKDVPETAWSNEYIQILASHGITTGSNGYFNPNEPLTRQHFSVFLYRTIDALAK